MIERDQLAALQAENARLIAVLESHGIKWRLPPEPVPVKATAVESSLSKPQKVALFRGLFSGRTDVFPERWENKSKGKSGYSPTCANLWVAGLCNKMNIKFRTMAWMAEVQVDWKKMEDRWMTAVKWKVMTEWTWKDPRALKEWMMKSLPRTDEPNK